MERNAGLFGHGGADLTDHLVLLKFAVEQGAGKGVEFALAGHQGPEDAALDAHDNIFVSVEGDWILKLDPRGEKA